MPEGGSGMKMEKIAIKWEVQRQGAEQGGGSELRGTLKDAKERQERQEGV